MIKKDIDYNNLTDKFILIKNIDYPFIGILCDIKYQDLIS